MTAGEPPELWEAKAVVDTAVTPHKAQVTVNDCVQDRGRRRALAALLWWHIVRRFPAVVITVGGVEESEILELIGEQWCAPGAGEAGS